MITGASRGIGRAVAERLAADGYDLHLICRKNENLLKELPGHHYIGNVGDHHFVSEIFQKIDRLDVLVNNAGISKIGLIQDLTPGAWEELFNVNLTSVYNTCHFAVPLMLRQHSGRIINISSQWGCAGASTEAAYAATKGGVNAFTRSLGKELAPSNIQVNAIACGVIDTDMNRSFSEEDRLLIKEEIPAGRFGSPEDVADLVSSLINTTSYLTGQIIGLDGGWI